MCLLNFADNVYRHLLGVQFPAPYWLHLCIRSLAGDRSTENQWRIQTLRMGPVGPERDRQLEDLGTLLTSPAGSGAELQLQWLGSVEHYEFPGRGLGQKRASWWPHFLRYIRSQNIKNMHRANEEEAWAWQAPWIHHCSERLFTLHGSVSLSYLPRHRASIKQF